MTYIFQEAVAGFSAGVSGTIIGYPLDVIKTRMQAQKLDSVRKAANVVYSTQGMSGFFRGILAPILSLSILNTINFSTYNASRRAFGSDTKSSDIYVPISGAVVGVLAAVVSTPFELIKIQTQFGQFSSSSAIRIAFSILKTHGFRTLYTGHKINTLREMLFLSTYFSVYENSRCLFTAALFPSWCGIPLAGGLAGSIGWVVSFPLDSIKSRVQGAKLANAKEMESILALAGKLLKERGLRGMYSGVLPSLMRAFVVSSCRFVVYEAVVGMSGADIAE